MSPLELVGEVLEGDGGVLLLLEANMLLDTEWPS